MRKLREVGRMLPGTFMVMNILLVSACFTSISEAQEEPFFYETEGKVFLELLPETVGVKFVDGTVLADAMALAMQCESNLVKQHDRSFWELATPAGMKPQEFIDALLSQEEIVEFAAPVYLIRSQRAILVDLFVARFTPEFSEPDIDAFNAKHHVQVVRRLPRPGGVFSYVLKVTKDSELDALWMANLYHEQDFTLWAQPDFITYPLASEPPRPNDTMFDKIGWNAFYQWSLNNEGNWLVNPGEGVLEDADIDALEAWQISKGSPSTVIAIVDSGVDLDHPDLQRNLWKNAGEIPGNGQDDDGNGYVDDYYGYDFWNSDSNPDDDYGHGTQVAGVAGAVTNNGRGIAGIAGGWYPAYGAKIMALKSVSSYGGGFLSYLATANAVYYAAQNEAHVISLSLRWDFDYAELRNAVAYARMQGCVVVAAGGNENSSAPKYPADYDGVLKVGGTLWDDERWTGSNWGDKLDVMAPTLVISTDIVGAGGNDPGDYVYGVNKTSIACPHVSGIAALLKSYDAPLTNTQIDDIICTTTDKVRAELYTYVDSPGHPHGPWNEYMGYGRVNAYKALLKAKLHLAPVQIRLGSLPRTPSCRWRYSISTAHVCVNSTWVGRLRDDTHLRSGLSTGMVAMM